VLARLTDRQIDEIYAHPRDENGRLARPAPPLATLSLAERLMQAEAAMSAFRVPAEEQERAFESIRRSHEENRGVEGGGGGH